MKKITTKKAFYILLLLTTTFFLQSCELFGDDNETSQLPEATQTGKGTFACMINGEPYVVTNTSKQVAIFQKNVLQFGSDNIFIILEEPLEINNNYTLIDNASYYVDLNPQLGCQYELADSYEGFIRFTKIDKVNFIISGKFEFSTKKDDCEDIKITQGVFDLRYIP